MKSFFQLIALVCLVSVQQAFACSCIPATAETWKKAKTVFTGSVLSSEIQEEDAGEFKIFKMKRIDAIKNSTGEEVLVKTRAAEMSCGVEFKADTVYTVYATTDKAPYEVSACGGSHPGRPSKKELRALKYPR
jgi:hypothetical protein